MDPWGTVATHIARSLGVELAPTAITAAPSGCTSGAAVLATNAGKYFIKHGARDREDMYAAEAEALREIRQTGAIRVPTPICWGVAENVSFLALEHLDLIGASASVQGELGRRLARLHQVTQAQFGWHRNNTIGATPQINDYASNWVEFFRERRLRYQLTLATRCGYPQLAERAEPLLAELESFFDGNICQPSLLHGDLWCGNIGATRAGDAVVFDPALYYGDREADVAMTKLFGGFDNTFYDSYEAEWPLPPGHEARSVLYNWYHVLNHLNLFGTSYLAQAQRMLAQLLSEIR